VVKQQLMQLLHRSDSSLRTHTPHSAVSCHRQQQQQLQQLLLGRINND